MTPHSTTFSNSPVWISLFVLLQLFAACSPEKSPVAVVNAPSEDDTIYASSGHEQFYVWVRSVVSGPDAACATVADLAQRNASEQIACFPDQFDKSIHQSLIRCSVAGVSGLNKEIATFSALELHDARIMFAELIRTEMLTSDTGVYIWVRHPVADFDGWYTVFQNMYTFKEMEGIHTVGVFRDVTDTLVVSVLMHAMDMGKASRYAKLLEEGRIMQAGGVQMPIEASVMRSRAK